MRRALSALALVGLLLAAVVVPVAAEGVPTEVEAESAAIATRRRLLRRRGFGAG
jgi:hypothetical protein